MSNKNNKNSIYKNILSSSSRKPSKRRAAHASGLSSSRVCKIEANEALTSPLKKSNQVRFNNNNYSNKNTNSSSN